ncbi:hypothetical protein IGI04_029807 [Brassica rapa subsp. trilocularis]|uniref:Uncharacterized protein n=1 Tax=Brassica rapa subsp. trilocularis TaxID=1813537 RepID=A0ABQ7LSU0_BRACM|nr:hypothetical protein IGI04_029807 [Brassica rapa subsp. trilocularis]
MSLCTSRFDCIVFPSKCQGCHFQDEARKYASHEEGLVAHKASLEAEASRSSKSREKQVALERKRVELEMSTKYGSSVSKGRVYLEDRDAVQ